MFERLPSEVRAAVLATEVAAQQATEDVRVLALGRRSMTLPLPATLATCPSGWRFAREGGHGSCQGSLGGSKSSWSQQTGQAKTEWQICGTCRNIQKLSKTAEYSTSSCFVQIEI